MDLLGGIGTIASGVLNWLGNKDANKANAENAANNIALQREFAQNGIRWKVEDAQRAGVHPLYALGASTTGFSPVSVGATNTMAPLAEMSKDLGQDLSRAVSAKTTNMERTLGTISSAQQLESNKLDLEFKKLRIAEIKGRILNSQTQTPPAMPDAVTYKPDDPEKQPVIGVEGNVFKPQPGWANAEDVEKAYGDVVQEAFGIAKLGRDLVYNSPQMYRGWLNATERAWSAPFKRIWADPARALYNRGYPRQSRNDMLRRYRSQY